MPNSSPSINRRRHSSFILVRDATGQLSCGATRKVCSSTLAPTRRSRAREGRTSDTSLPLVEAKHHSETGVAEAQGKRVYCIDYAVVRLVLSSHSSSRMIVLAIFAHVCEMFVDGVVLQVVLHPTTPNEILGL